MVVKSRVSDWLATSRPKRIIQLTNLKNKIAEYETVLPFPKAKTDQIVLICETYVALTQYTEQMRARAEALTGYNELMETAKGGKQGSPAPAFEGVEPITLPEGAFVGLIVELRALVDDIKHCDNYTREIGKDLMILPPEGEEINRDDIKPEMKTQAVASTYRVRVEGSLQGMDAVRADWRKKGATQWQNGIGFLTKLPGDVTVPNDGTGEPESGDLRFIMIDENEPVGQFSLNHPITAG